MVMELKGEYLTVEVRKKVLRKWVYAMYTINIIC